MVVFCTPDLEFVVKVTPAFFIAKEEVEWSEETIGEQGVGLEGGYPPLKNNFMTPP